MNINSAMPQTLDGHMELRVRIMVLGDNMHVFISHQSPKLNRLSVVNLRNYIDLDVNKQC